MADSKHNTRATAGDVSVTATASDYDSLVEDSRVPFVDTLGAGDVIASYELIRELGRGGMGRVMLARDLKLGRRVAIKLLARASAGVAERFLREARMTARLHHENVVVIHEVNEQASLPFMVLEYLEGQSLAQLIRAGALPWPRAVEIGVAILRALGHAHGAGIIHRDLKPSNVFVTETGAVKVLDFGIAKAFRDSVAEPRSAPVSSGAVDNRPLTRDGAIVGTLAYMAPEQLRRDSVDHRADLWAFGLILFELLTGAHPLAPLTPPRLYASADALDEPMPGIAGAVPELPDALVQAVNGCLRKRAGERTASAAELLGLLEPLRPGHYGRHLADGESPYPGLSAFQERDAARFFGRRRDVVRVTTQVRERPLVAIIGPSGIGKSSLVRAGVIPALKASADRWESFVIRPGREPISALANLVASVTSSGSDGDAGDEHDAVVARLRNEPGYLGALLRGRARRHNQQVVLFVDQFEELFTLVDSPREQRAFVDSLAGAADDAGAPVRVIVSMRSDFLDRVAEHPRFVRDVTRGLIVLAGPDEQGLRDALERPLELASYRFESDEIATDMLSTLAATPSSLSLLQFIAARLWDARDRERRMITVAAYESMGRIAGALASHADDALTRLSVSGRQVARAMFQRLVTPERTRAIVDTDDLLGLCDDADEAQRVLDQLVTARLVVVQPRGDSHGAAAELVHESLIETWPTLRHWLDRSAEDATFVAELQNVSKQWHTRGRPRGLLWRGDAAAEAQRWLRTGGGVLAPRERDYLEAVVGLAGRTRRLKRLAVIGTITVLSIMVAGAVAVLFVIRNAEGEARAQAKRANKAAALAKQAQAKSARDAEEARRQRNVAAERLQKIRDKDRLVARGKSDLRQINAKLATANEELKRALAESQHQRERALRAQRTAEHSSHEATKAQKQAEAARRRAQAAQRRWRKLYEEKAAKVRELQRLRRRFD